MRLKYNKNIKKKKTKKYTFFTSNNTSAIECARSYKLYEPKLEWYTGNVSRV